MAQPSETPAVTPTYEHRYRAALSVATTSLQTFLADYYRDPLATKLLVDVSELTVHEHGEIRAGKRLAITPTFLLAKVGGNALRDLHVTYSPEDGSSIDTHASTASGGLEEVILQRGSFQLHSDVQSVLTKLQADLHNEFKAISSPNLKHTLGPNAFWKFVIDVETGVFHSWDMQRMATIPIEAPIRPETKGFPLFLPQ